MKNQVNLKPLYWVSVIIATLMLTAYPLIALFFPFNTSINAEAEITWNDFWLDILTILPALLGALLATLVTRSYQRSEPARGIWLYFSIGLWLWCLAEIVWTVYNLTLGDVPTPSIADLLWFIGYVAFSIAIFRQYHLIYRPSRQKEYLITGAIWLGILFLSSLITWMVAGFDITAVTFSGLVNIFYPVVDLAVAVAVLYLVRTFGRGAMMRPWLGLFIFAFADSIYAVLYETGIYTFTALTGNAASIAADTVYMAAYLSLTLGLFFQFLLVNYGPAILIKQKPQTGK